MEPADPILTLVGFRGDLSLEERVGRAVSLGFDAVEAPLAEETSVWSLAEALSARKVRLAVAAQSVAPGGGALHSLAAVERRASVDAAVRFVRHAARLGALHLRLACGRVRVEEVSLDLVEERLGSGQPSEEIAGGALAHRKRHDGDRLEGAGHPLLRNGSGGGVPIAPKELLDRYLEGRARDRDRRVENCCRSLYDLTRIAEGTVCLAAGPSPGSFPDLDEMEMILAEFGPRRVGYWHSVSACHLRERSGLEASLDWLGRVGHRAFGVHLDDVQGTMAGFPAGSGEADYRNLREFVPSRLPCVVSLTSPFDRDPVIAGVMREFIGGLGLLTGPAGLRGRGR